MLAVPIFWQVAMASWALTYLLHSTVLIALAWGITRLVWFRAPRTSEVIWTVALLGGLTTSFAATLDRTRVVERRVDVELSMVRGEVPLPQPGEHMERMVWQSGPEVSGTLAAGPGEACRKALMAPGAGEDAWLESVRAGCVAAGVPGSMRSGNAGWMLPLLLLWLLGAVALGWRELGRHRALRRIRLGLEPADRRVTYTLARVVDGLEMGTVRARVSTEVDTPCVVDSRTVVLPPRCQEELEDPELLAVLAHEVAHICRRDVRWQSLFRWIAVVFWFQPLNRLVLGQLHDVVELICDDWAVGRIPRPVDLARSISRVAEWSAPRSRRQPVLAGHQGGRLHERVRRILASGRGGRTEGGLRGALVAVALVATLTQLPTVQLPGAVRGIFVLQQGATLDGTAMDTAAVDHLRVRIRDFER